MKTVKKIIPALIMLLGLIHLSFAFPLNDLEIDALLFIGAGLAIVFAGAINLFAQMNPHSMTIKVSALICNAIMFALFVIGTSILIVPVVFAGIILFLVSTILAISDLSSSNAS